MVLSENQLHVNVDKFPVGQPCLEYLGHRVSVEGVATDEGKIQAILDWPVPRNVKKLCSFLGLASSQLS